MSEWLTTGQMIDRLKVGEVAENQDGYRVMFGRKGDLLYFHQSQEPDEEERFTACLMFLKKDKWLINPKYISFEEATEAYEEGKTIKCEYDSVIDGAKCYEKFALNKHQYEGSLSFYMITKGKWTIEE